MMVHNEFFQLGVAVSFPAADDTRCSLTLQHEAGGCELLHPIYLFQLPLPNHPEKKNCADRNPLCQIIVAHRWNVTVEFQNLPVCGGLTKSTVLDAHILEDLLETPNFQHHKSQQTPWAKGPQHGLSFHINSRIPLLLLNRSLSASKSGAVSDIATSPAANPKSSKVSKTIAFSNAFMFVGVGWDVCRDAILVSWRGGHDSGSYCMSKQLRQSSFVVLFPPTSIIHPMQNMKRFTDSRHSAISPHMLAQTHKWQSNVCLGPLKQFQCNFKLFCFERKILMLCVQDCWKRKSGINVGNIWCLQNLHKLWQEHLGTITGTRTFEEQNIAQPVFRDKQSALAKCLWRFSENRVQAEPEIEW